MQIFIVLFSIIILLTNSTSSVKHVNNFSTETRAVCEEIENPYCHYICYDEIFLHANGKEISLEKIEGYVCQNEDWIDPRINQLNN